MPFQTRDVSHLDYKFNPGDIVEVLSPDNEWVLCKVTIASYKTEVGQGELMYGLTYDKPFPQILSVLPTGRCIMADGDDLLAGRIRLAHMSEQEFDAIVVKSQGQKRERFLNRLREDATVPIHVAGMTMYSDDDPQPPISLDSQVDDTTIWVHLSDWDNDERMVKVVAKPAEIKVIVRFLTLLRGWDG
jgi:hypothetical protein